MTALAILGCIFLFLIGTVVLFAICSFDWVQWYKQLRCDHQWEQTQSKFFWLEWRGYDHCRLCGKDRPPAK